MKGVIDHGICFKPVSKHSLVGFTDADWPSSTDDCRSTSGYCTYFAKKLISWSSKKQGLVAYSTTEAECHALAHVSAELVWLCGLLAELGFDISRPPVIWCDNKSTISLAVNLVLHQRFKYIEIDIHFVHDKLLQHELEIRFVPSAHQVANIFTKPISTARFLLLRSKLYVVKSLFRLLGDVRIQAESVKIS